MNHSPPPSQAYDRADIDVSIIMAAYNSERFIAEAIKSCLGQTGVTFELIVCDDGSDQRLEPLVEKITGADSRVVTLTLTQNEGPASARNRALAIAKGEFVAIVDSDDWVTPSRIAELIETGRRTGADILVDNLIEFSMTSRGRQEWKFLKGADVDREREISLTEYMRSGLKQKSSRCFGYLKPVIRRSSLVEGGFSYRENLRISEDYYLLADMLRDGARMRYVPQTGYYYRRHAGSLTHRAAAQHIKMIVDEERSFRATSHPELSPEQVVWSRRRSLVFRRMYQFEKMANYIKHHRYLDALRTFLKRPPDMPFQISRGLFLLIRKATRT